MQVQSPRPTDNDVLSIFPEHSSISPHGELLIGGVTVTELAERFGTPAYIVDEAGLRAQARRMRDGLAARRPDRVGELAHHWEAAGDVAKAIALGASAAAAQAAPNFTMDQVLDYDSAARAAKVNFLVGYEIAQQDAAPAWKKGDFFGQEFGPRHTGEGE